MSRITSILAVGALVGLAILSGCSAGPQTGDAVSMQMSNCPVCKASYEWVYSSKGLPIGRREVKHNCPMCKKEWAAGVDPASACAECAKSELACPACRKAAGGGK